MHGFIGAAAAWVFPLQSLFCTGGSVSIAPHLLSVTFECCPQCGLCTTSQGERDGVVQGLWLRLAGAGASQLLAGAAIAAAGAANNEGLHLPAAVARDDQPSVPGQACAAFIVALRQIQMRHVLPMLPWWLWQSMHYAFCT